MVMRVLVTARLLWGRGGAVPMVALSVLVAADPAAVAMAVDRLCDESIAERAAGHTVRLTDRGARELVRHQHAAARAADRPSP